MMRKICTFLLTLCACLLTACGGTGEATGRVVAMDVRQGEGLVSFTVETEKGEQIALELTEGTHIFSFIEGLDEDRFREGELTDTAVWAEYNRAGRTVKAENGEKTRIYPAEHLEICGILSPETVSLDRETAANIWQYYNCKVYTLPDGTPLLKVKNPIGPENVSVGGTENFHGLEIEAQEKILEYYQSRGLLYDERAQLERAYRAWQETEGEGFVEYSLGQEISPSASSPRLIYFLTAVTLPIDGNYIYELCTCAAFDKSTGDYVDNSELFSCPREELAERLLDLADMQDEQLRQEMEQAFEPENLVFYSDFVELHFPAGTLPSQEHSWRVILEYDKGLENIMQDWAVPLKVNDKGAA